MALGKGLVSKLTMIFVNYKEVLCVVFLSFLEYSVMDCITLKFIGSDDSHHNYLGPINQAALKIGLLALIKPTTKSFIAMVTSMKRWNSFSGLLLNTIPSYSLSHPSYGSFAYQFEGFTLAMAKKNNKKVSWNILPSSPKSTGDSSPSPNARSIIFQKTRTSRRRSTSNHASPIEF